MNPQEFMNRLEKAFLLRPEAPTAAILVDVLDSFRAEVDKELLGARALAEGLKAENEQAYRYAIARYKPQGTALIAIEDYRLTERGLRDFATERNLDYNKLLAVAVGDIETYKGWRQGAYLRFTHGVPYKQASDDLPEPQVKKQGARGLFRAGLARTQEERE